MLTQKSPSNPEKPSTKSGHNETHERKKAKTCSNRNSSRKRHRSWCFFSHTIAKLSRFDTFPDWALPLKIKYLDDERASIEACDMAIQVIKDRVEREKRRAEIDQSIKEKPKKISEI
jgi:hypothetical protein